MVATHLVSFTRFNNWWNVLIDEKYDNGGWVA